MATVETTATGETQVTMVAGDAADIPLTILDDADPPAPVDLSKAVDGTVSRRAVVRMAVKDKPDVQENDEGLAYKVSHVDTEIEILDQSVEANLGKLVVRLDKPDTAAGIPTTAYRWDLEVTRQDAVREAASVGTAALVAGSALVEGTDTRFDLAKVGDVFQPTTEDGNATPAVVLEVISPTQLRTTFAGWSDEAAASFELRRGNSRTAFRGPFKLLQGIVK